MARKKRRICKRLPKRNRHMRRKCKGKTGQIQHKIGKQKTGRVTPKRENHPVFYLGWFYFDIKIS